MQQILHGFEHFPLYTLRFHLPIITMAFYALDL